MNANLEKKGIKANEIALMIQGERINKADAATMLSVSLGTISNYVTKGLLFPIKLGKTKQSPVYFTREDILKLIDFELKQHAFQR
ncbi:MAG: helix-turn-helix domain-containing protein [Bacteroidetes bacterium]|nr:helix-turn-helix domain-containing protein [Bacteroidota bacterium]